MPSGSHSTSGGSHSSGGSSFGGGSSFSGGHRGGGWHHGRGPYRRGRVYVNGRELGPLGSIIFFAVFLVIFCGIWLAVGAVMLVTRQKNLEKCEADYKYYQNMILVAEQAKKNGDSGFFVTGIVTGKFKSEYKNKWYLSYDFPANRVVSYPGETYAIYDFEDVKNIIPNETTILLVADSRKLTSTTDTIEYSYKNTTLEDDGYYLETKTSNIPVVILCFVVGIGCGILFISQIIKNAKELKELAPSKNKDDAPSLTLESSTPNKKYCAYCGNENNATSKRCSSCGARLE